MSVQVRVLEAKRLSNVTGSVKYQVQLREGSRKSDMLSSGSVPEDLNVIFNDDPFEL
jgi:hypothetical protein